MAVIVNGTEITDADMEVEVQFHNDADNPVDAAMTALILKRVLLDEAAELNIDGGDADAIIDAQGNFITWHQNAFAN